MILVTGATGNVGRALVAQLVAAGRPVRALVRRPVDDLPAAAEQVVGDLERPETLRALNRVESLFLLTPPRGHGGIAAVARAAGVRHIVLLSSIATQKADPKTNPIAARHAAAERAVLESGATSTLLRPDTFAANALEWAAAIRADGVVRLAFPDSQRCPIHEADLAAVAARALTDPAQRGLAHWLTGPESITQAQQVAAIGEAIGRTLRVEPLARADALAQLAMRMPVVAAERLLDYQERSVTKPPPVNDTAAALMGRGALPFTAWARDHAAAFR